MGKKKLVSWPNGSCVEVISLATGWMVHRPARTGANVLGSAEVLLTPGVGAVAYGGLDAAGLSSLSETPYVINS